MVLFLPTFNLVASVWNAGNSPSSGPADATDIPCQLYIDSRAGVDLQYGSPLAWTPPCWIRFPIAEVAAASSGIIYEVPQGSARYYKKRWVEVIHSGFPNEYWGCLVAQCTDTGTEDARDV